MTDPNYTQATVVVDRSGSMAGTADEATASIRQFIEDQRALPGKMTFTLVEFDDQIDTVEHCVDIHDVKPYTLAPRGMTALFDAVGEAITSTGKTLAALPEDERPGNVIVVIVTDGANNASQKWTLESVRGLIAQQEKGYGWQFMFFGAGAATWAGQQMGIANTVTYDPAKGGTSASYGAASALVTRTRTGGSPTP